MKKLLVPILLFSALILSGCSYAGKSDLNSLRSTVDALQHKQDLLEQRIAALEAAQPTPTPYERVSFGTPVPEDPRSAPVHNMTADGICSAFLKNGMPVVSFIRYSASDDPDGLMGTNGGYTSRADFKDKETPDAKGIVEVYASAYEASLRMNALRFERMQNGDDTEEQMFCYDNVLLRLPAAFSTEQGLRYEEALRKVLGLMG